TLQSDYPRELIEIIVVSDASTDRTNKLVAQYALEGVKLIVNKEQHGKTYGLNRAWKEAKGEILIFTDADAMFEGETLSLLVAKFADSNVGLVTGSTRYYTANDAKNIVMAMGLYTRYERWIKKLETCLWACVGADGAVFAMRRDLFQPLREADINDFVLPLDVVRQGKRVIFHEKVFCLEEHTTDDADEFGRQVRMANRTIMALIHHRDLLNVCKFGLFSWMLFSHKVLRFLLPWITLLLISLNLVLLFSNQIYQLTMTIIITVFCSYFLFKNTKNRFVSLFVGFITINLAYFAAWKKVFKKETIVVWGKDERL
ncbi:glycosyltransferase, partial [Thermodesulfobacteriota bacterium]